MKGIVIDEDMKKSGYTRIFSVTTPSFSVYDKKEHIAEKLERRRKRLNMDYDSYILISFIIEGKIIEF